MKKYLLILILFLLLSSCKNTADVKFNEINSRCFDLKLKYDLSLVICDNIIKRQINMKQGFKLIDNESKELTLDELEALNQGFSYLNFTPTSKDIADANKIIRKINDIKPLMAQVISLCEQTYILYTKGKSYDYLDKIIKHSETDYALMEKKFQEVKRINKEISLITGISCVFDFLKQYDSTGDKNGTYEMLLCFE